MDAQRFEHPGRQHWAKAERQTGAAPDFLHRHGDDMRQSLPAILRLPAHAIPAGFDEPPVGVLEPLRGRYLSVGEPGAFLVALAIEWVKHITRELARLFQDLAHELGVDLLATRQRVHFREPRELTDREQHVLQRCYIHRHSANAADLAYCGVCD